MLSLLWRDAYGDKNMERVHIRPYRIGVLNAGVSIEKDVVSKLFDPFYGEGKAQIRKNGRSGLGLTIVKKPLGLIKFLRLHIIRLLDKAFSP